MNKDHHVTPGEVILQAAKLEKCYRMGPVTVPVLRGVDLEILHGSWVALLGASGSGKTTLLNLLGSLEQPDKGEILYRGAEYSRMSNLQMVHFRRRQIGFIFQSYHMLPELTVRENVELPGMMDGYNRAELRERSEMLLERVGLKHRIKHRPYELSGGEQQRAAIARALINRPKLVLADEPTGNLDSKTGSGILDIFKQLHAESEPVTIVMVTHDRNVAAMADRIVELQDGLIVGQQ